MDRSIGMDKISYIGIDPGQTGGISIFEVGMQDELPTSVALVDSLRMPVTDSPRYKTKKSKRILVEELDAVIRSYNVTHGCVELVSAMPSLNKEGKTVQGAASTFAFGYGTGQMEGILFLNQIKLSWVMPAVWKKHFGLIKCTKMDSVNLAGEWWPDFEFTRLVDNGRAEAALVGLYGITKNLRG